MKVFDTVLRIYLGVCICFEYARVLNMPAILKVLNMRVYPLGYV